MPQGSLRSIVYKSFVTCDDPKGVAECKTIRKSSTDSHKIKNQKNSSTSPSLEKEWNDKFGKESAEDLQVMEVSSGARKLNEFIESWSNRTSYDSHSEYIAEDLLKGALDLQESLAMLRKLQETSPYMAKSKKGDKEKPVGNGTTDFNLIGDYDHFQKPRASNASSKDCYEELREVIVESFARNNLLPKSLVHEKDFVSRKSVDFSTDVPSSSSSHSWSSDCSASRGHYEMPKRPNLIAKLMGLDEVPSKQANSIIGKQIETRGISRHLHAFDLPRQRKPQFMIQKPARETRALEEIIKTMQFKVLVEKISIDGPNSHSECLTPPIVIMKPLHVLDLRLKESHANYTVDDEKSVKSKRLVLPFNFSGVQGECLSFTELNEKLPAKKAPIKKLRDKQGKNISELPRRLPKKITNNIQDVHSFVKIRHSKPPTPSMQKKETMVKKINSVPKMSLESRKQADIKPSKSQGSINGRDLSKTAISKVSSRPGKGSNVTKSMIALGKHMDKDKQTTPKASLKFSISKKSLKEDKPESNPSETSVQITPGDDDISISMTRNILESTFETTSSELVPEEVTSACSNPTSDSCGNAANYPCDLSFSTIEGIKYVKDGSSTPCQILDQKKVSQDITNTSCLLLCSASFLSHAKVLLDIETGDPTACLPGSEPHDTHLLLECAKEITECKSLRCTMFPLSPSYLTREPKCHLSLEQLVNEISDVFEDLRSYSKSFGETAPVDTISLLLKRDLWWNREVTGVWCSGWRNGFSVEEVNQVANDLQNLLLSKMVDDVVTEFMF